MINIEPVPRKHGGSRFQRQLSVLIWKSYNQRKRRWRILALEVAFAIMCFVCAAIVARPVFLTPPVAEGGTTLTTADILLTLDADTEVAYAPDTPPYDTIMARVGAILQKDIERAPSVDVLLRRLHSKARVSKVKPLIWIIWKQNDNNIWKLSIQSTELAKKIVRTEFNQSVNPTQASSRNKHLLSGFLAVQIAVSRAVIEHAATTDPLYELLLGSMPVSPIMHEERVKRTISWMLIWFTAALLPAILESQAVAVRETHNQFKRALRLRNVDYSTMYIGWLVYAQMTLLPICALASVTLILTFRWIHLFTGFVFVFAYASALVIVDFVMGMFHHKIWISCLWCAMVTVLQTFLAELLIHHNYDDKHPVLVFLLNVGIPSLSLVHGFHQFALLQMGSGFAPRGAQPVLWIIISWITMMCFYFGVLMMLQRTRIDAYGGPVTWSSIIFKQADARHMLYRIDPPEVDARPVLQEVDDLVAKAVIFQNVYKAILNVHVLDNISFNIYRGEFTMFYVEPSDYPMLTTLEDIITGLTFADKGTVNILGNQLVENKNYLSVPYMMGYCHSSDFLIRDLTVEEHLTLFTEINIWNESYEFIYEYTLMRKKKLFIDCNLKSVARVQVKYLSSYFKAQLCWAIAVLLEPRIIVIPKFTDDSYFIDVIKDKILRHKGHLTIIKMCYSSNELQFADRVFVFDRKLLVFGGTPAYMFFMYGREYRVRVTMGSEVGDDGEDAVALVERAREAGAAVRAHQGSVIVFRVPAFPTAAVTELVRDLTVNRERYGIKSFQLTLPDTEEVVIRAVTEFRTQAYNKPYDRLYFKKYALRRIGEPTIWRRKLSNIITLEQIKHTGWKYFSFYMHYKLILTFTIAASLITGVVMGISMTHVLQELSLGVSSSQKSSDNGTLTVEAIKKKTMLVIRSDISDQSLSLANSYVLSSPNVPKENAEKIFYTGLLDTENLEGYLMVRAVDNPEDYLYHYAYGIDILNVNGKLSVEVLHSPLHEDRSAAARSLARAHMALLRHYSGVRHATIEVVDEPLTLDLTTFMESLTMPPLFIEFMSILTVAHTTFLPSKEHGLIRHSQTHAMDYSPFRYWLTLFLCDLMTFWMLVTLAACAMFIVVLVTVPMSHYAHIDLVIIPVMLFTYGIGSIPMSYIFSLGRNPGLNVMAFVTVNLVLGETTMITRLFYGYWLNTILLFMNLSPQFNMAYSYMKIKRILAYNSECKIFDVNQMCSSNLLHKCCPKYCGVMQDCFKRKQYFSKEGILTESISLLVTSVVFILMLMLWEYKVVLRLWNFVSSRWLYPGTTFHPINTLSTIQEKKNVEIKKKFIKKRANRRPSKRQRNPFGDILLVDNVSEKRNGLFHIRNVSFGLGKGDALAVVGQEKDGRVALCRTMAGVRLPTDGNARVLNKLRLRSCPYKYAAQVSYSCEKSVCPDWMKLRHVLEMLALLRGVPSRHIHDEADLYLEALELHSAADMVVKKLTPIERTRANVAAAFVGAPPLIILDEATACQKFSVRRAIYTIIIHLLKKGHAILFTSSYIESHIPIANRLAILANGYIFDIDHVNNLLSRYSQKGFTVVVYVKNEIDVDDVFSGYFEEFVVNDITEALVNVQVLDGGLQYVEVFDKMERLLANNPKVYTYVVAGASIDHLYSTLYMDEDLAREVRPKMPLCCYFKICHKKIVYPTEEMKNELIQFEEQYNIEKLHGLPWSVVFQR